MWRGIFLFICFGGYCENSTAIFSEDFPAHCWETHLLTGIKIQCWNKSCGIFLICVRVCEGREKEDCTRREKMRERKRGTQCAPNQYRGIGPMRHVTRDKFAWWVLCDFPMAWPLPPSPPHFQKCRPGILLTRQLRRRGVHLCNMLRPHLAKSRATRVARACMRVYVRQLQPPSKCSNVVLEIF